MIALALLVASVVVFALVALSVITGTATVLALGLALGFAGVGVALFAGVTLPRRPPL